MGGQITSITYQTTHLNDLKFLLTQEVIQDSVVFLTNFTYHVQLRLKKYKKKAERKRIKKREKEKLETVSRLSFEGGML